MAPEPAEQPSLGALRLWFRRTIAASEAAEAAVARVWSGGLAATEDLIRARDLNHEDELQAGRAFAAALDDGAGLVAAYSRAIVATEQTLAAFRAIRHEALHERYLLACQEEQQAGRALLAALGAAGGDDGD